MDAAAAENYYVSIAHLVLPSTSERKWHCAFILLSFHFGNGMQGTNVSYMRNKEREDFGHCGEGTEYEA